MVSAKATYHFFTHVINFLPYPNSPIPSLCLYYSLRKVGLSHFTLTCRAYQLMLCVFHYQIRRARKHIDSFSACFLALLCSKLRTLSSFIYEHSISYIFYRCHMDMDHLDILLADPLLLGMASLSRQFLLLEFVPQVLR